MSKLLNPTTLTVHWHDSNLPVYSLDFQPNTKGLKSARLATGGGDNNVRIWKLIYNEDETEVVSVEYLSTLAKHTQAVNCVRFDPTGEMLASASDDGTIMIWHLSDKIIKEFGSNDDSIKESWYLKTSCRSSSISEIYDISWSPDSKFICCGSMDNITRIYNSSTGLQVKQIAEHSHYVQGVSWDPRSEFIASQSADRSVHIYQILPNNSQSNNELNLSPTTFYKITRAELPTRKLSQQPSFHEPQPHSVSSMIPPTHTTVHRLTSENLKKMTMTSTPTPVSAFTPKDSTTQQPSSSAMNPPSVSSHKRRLSTSSTGSTATSVSIHRGATASPLPAVRSIEPTQIYKAYQIYHNETLQSFFRRLTFSPDGLLLFTASGIYKEGGVSTNNETENTNNTNSNNTNNQPDNIINTVYIHSRSGLNKPPIAHLPGLKKPAIVIKFSDIIYKLDPNYTETPVFKLNYRMVFAVATQDSVLIYDTQRLKPIGIVSNLHYAIITDVSWSSDGRTLAISSADGFVSSLVIDQSILGEVETYDLHKWLKEHPLIKSSAVSTSTSVESSASSTPLLTSASMSAVTSMSKLDPVVPSMQTTSVIKTEDIGAPAKQMTILDAFLSSSANKKEPEVLSPQKHLNTQIPLHMDDKTKIEVIDITDQPLTEGSEGLITSTEISNCGSNSELTHAVPSTSVESVPTEKKELNTDKTEKSKKRRIAPTLVTTPSENKE